MSFTALHRVAGAAPGPVTDELLDSAVANHASETDDLDWKKQLPEAKGLPQAEFPKDVAAMANSGGGMIVYGVCEQQGAATVRVDVGDLIETHERSLLSSAITAISPPVFGLKIHRLSGEGKRAVVVEIPRSLDGPHLIYRGEYFGAPMRNGADTVWMKERQIEAMYRARFDERRHATEALDTLFVETSSRHNARLRAWLTAVAHPRVPRLGPPLSQPDARNVLESAVSLALGYADRRGMHPLENVDRLNPRTGLRRWVAVNTAIDESSWKEAWISVHHDGSVTLAAAVGGHRKTRTEYFEGHEIESAAIEAAMADLMAVVRRTAEVTGNDEYEVRVGIEWSGDDPLTILGTDFSGRAYDGESIPVRHFTPVEATLNAAESDVEFQRHLYELARDCINQGGIADVRTIRQPPSDAQV